MGYVDNSPVLPKASAYTQTDSTAAKTVASPVQTAVATTAPIALLAGFGFSTSEQAADVIAQLNNAKTDLANLKKVVNSLVDDLQAANLVA